MVRAADAGADRHHHRLLPCKERQLRRLDERPALADVAGSVMSAVDAGGRGSARFETLGPWSGVCPAGAVGDVDELLVVEPLASSVDLPLDGCQRLDTLLTVRERNLCRPAI